MVVVTFEYIYVGYILGEHKKICDDILSKHH